eukprot:TRINITY_DN8953_c0_g2_i1.p1 TRINITY_DN8953_c0_g2~~TRINITY_DN8953_c0_g2_i1.p1  ORF type:complete len:372 (+),score=88.33 TRINITY_DN8953_c0_g2_i1:1092-2207(+)
MIFDIKQRENSQSTLTFPVASPLPIEPSFRRDDVEHKISNIYELEFIQPFYAMDKSTSKFFKISLNLPALCTNFSDRVKLVEFLLCRQNSKPLLIEVLRSCILDKEHLNVIISIFNILSRLLVRVDAIQKQFKEDGLMKNQILRRKSDPESMNRRTTQYWKKFMVMQENNINASNKNNNTNNHHNHHHHHHHRHNNDVFKQDVIKNDHSFNARRASSIPTQSEPLPRHSFNMPTITPSLPTFPSSIPSNYTGEVGEVETSGRDRKSTRNRPLSFLFFSSSQPTDDGVGGGFGGGGGVDDGGFWGGSYGEFSGNMVPVIFLEKREIYTQVLLPVKSQVLSSNSTIAILPPSLSPRSYFFSNSNQWLNLFQDI